MTLNVLADEYTDIPTGSPADMYGKMPIWSTRKNLVSNIVREARPDVLGLQEDSIKQRSDLVTEMPDYAFASFDKRQASTYGGVSLLGTIFFRKEKFELIRSGTFQLYGARNATWTVLRHKSNQAEFLFINSHFYGGITDVQIESIEQFVKKIPRAIKVIVLGDFNAKQSQLRSFTQKLALNIDQSGRRKAYYANAEGYSSKLILTSTDTAIDHIYSSEEIIESKASLWLSVAENEENRANYRPYQSDHGAVMVELKVEESRLEDNTKAEALIYVIQLLLSE